MDWIKTAIGHLNDLSHARPDYFSFGFRDGCRRGIDVYSRDDFVRAYANALAIFHEAHERLPNLVSLPETSDILFKLKFFDYVRVAPNPASKLAARHYITTELASSIRTSKIAWVSERPRLPPDEELAPGAYWLKFDLGNGGHTKIEWPLSDTQRNNIDAMLDARFPRRYGVSWGEWWYGLGKQSVFLEEDLSAVVDTGQELKFFVRHGQAVGGYSLKFSHAGGGHDYVFGFFDEQGSALPGILRYGVRVAPSGAFDFRKPDNFSELSDIARRIGSAFDLIRVDMFVPLQGKPLLGELSICSWNARQVLSPNLEEFFRNALSAPPR